jgi:coenzyme F420-0:L-glutamate ligase/coenzyme F420-1:gamma-L-glutamate ligase
LLKNFTVYALEGFPLIKPGDDVARTIIDSARKNGLMIEDGDVIVIAQKIVSKAESRVVELERVVPSARAEGLAEITGKDPRFIELVLKETKRVIKVSREVLLVEDKRGLICINAGIDKSNVEGRTSFALLPKDSSASAEKYRSAIKEFAGRSVAVVVCDTYSRPFRRGQVNYAIGVAGLKLFRDYRGKRDLFGQVLKVKNVAVVDEIAAAAELLMGQAREATPVVILRGLDGMVAFCEECDFEEMYIEEEADLFKGVL